MKKKRKQVVKTHKAAIGQIVKFKHAGMIRNGEIIELTKDSLSGEATYTAIARNIIYPCLGINGSKATGYIII